MERYIFTRTGHEGLLKVIDETQKIIDKIMKAKAEGFHDTDGWHSESYKIASVDEMTWRGRMEKLNAIKRNAKVVDPPEQNEHVVIGNGILLQRENGSTQKCFLGGYRVDKPPKEHISIHGPLGKALIRAQADEQRTFRIGDEEITVKVLRIVPPSQVETFLREE